MKRGVWIWGAAVLFGIVAALWSCGSAPNRERVALPEATVSGANKCLACHEAHGLGIAGTAHGMSKDPRTPASAHGCETCHGPGSVHIKNRSEKKMISST